MRDFYICNNCAWSNVDKIPFHFIFKAYLWPSSLSVASILHTSLLLKINPIIIRKPNANLLILWYCVSFQKMIDFYKF